jgi:hypothetical protein
MRMPVICSHVNYMVHFLKINIVLSLLSLSTRSKLHLQPHSLTLRASNNMAWSPDLKLTCITSTRSCVAESKLWQVASCEGCDFYVQPDGTLGGTQNQKHTSSQARRAQTARRHAHLAPQNLKYASHVEEATRRSVRKSDKQEQIRAFGQDHYSDIENVDTQQQSRAHGHDEMHTGKVEQSSAIGVHVEAQAQSRAKQHKTHENEAGQSLRQQACVAQGLPNLCTATMSQQYPYPAVVNTITLGLKANVDMPAGEERMYVCVCMYIYIYIYIYI